MCEFNQTYNCGCNCGCSPCSCGCGTDDFNVKYKFYYDQLVGVVGGKFQPGSGSPDSQFPPVDITQYLYYLDFVTGDIYKYVSGSWTLIGSLPIENITADNGLTKTLSNIQLGGPIIQDTTISSILGNTIDITSSDGLNNVQFKLEPAATQAVKLGYTGGSSNNAVTVGLAGVRSLFNNGLGFSDFSVAPVAVLAGPDYPAHSVLFTVTDNQFERGIEYLGDYEANFVARSLVTKRYVDAAVTITASNGLTKTGNDIALGGTWNQDILLNGGTNSKFFQIETYTPGFATGALFAISPTSFSNGIEGSFTGVTRRSEFKFNNDEASIWRYNPAGGLYTKLKLADTGGEFLDSLSSIGIRYFADYSANNTGGSYNPLWIPAQKDVIQNRLITGTAQTASFNVDTISKVSNLQLSEIAIPDLAIDFNAAGVQYKDVAANTTFTFSNSLAGKSVQVVVTNTSGGTITIGFTGATPPLGADHTILAGATKIFSFLCSRSSIYEAIIGY